jgi:nondiscriminating aspartyl-tRNA synthetase
MLTRTLASQLADHASSTVRIRGWYNALRSMGKVNFLILRDRTGLIQVVIEDKGELAKIKPLFPGSVLDIVGTVTPSAQAQGGYEITNPTIIVESEVTTVLPIEYNKPEIPSDLETILDYRSISLRNRKIQAVFRLQGEIAHAYRLFMHDHINAAEYFGPNMVGASSEGGAEFFTIDYFGHPATLAQSSQLYKQMMVGVNERVFAIMPFFRAEKSHTVRHLTEGKQLEFEMGFFDSWHEIMDVEEACIKYIVNHLKTNCAADVQALENQIVDVPLEKAFPRLTFAEAQEVYFKRTGVDDRQEDDLSPAAERELCAYAREQFGTDCIFITDWLAKKRPFYSYPNPENPELTNTFDLLCGGSEITSGGQRRHTEASMIEGLKEKGLDPIYFEDYLSIFRFGMPPHGGFGLGLERLTMTILKLKNVREASLFPSDPKRIAGNRLKAKVFSGQENVRNEIVRLLREHEMPFEHLTHEATPTSEDSARVRNTTLKEGVKAIIVRGKSSKRNFQINVPSDCRLDMKAVSDAVGERCEFESPELIQERYGLPVGGIPPFGNLLNLPTYFDTSVQEQPRSAFNCGLLTESIVMQSKDLIALVQPTIGSFVKQEA